MSNEIEARRTSEFRVEAKFDFGRTWYVSAVNALDAIRKVGLTEDTTHVVHLMWQSKNSEGRTVDRFTCVWR